MTTWTDVWMFKHGVVGFCAVNFLDMKRLIRWPIRHNWREIGLLTLAHAKVTLERTRETDDEDVDETTTRIMSNIIAKSVDEHDDDWQRFSYALMEHIKTPFFVIRVENRSWVGLDPIEADSWEDADAYINKLEGELMYRRARVITKIGDKAVVRVFGDSKTGEIYYWDFPPDDSTEQR